ncbi:sugar O-acetyltransferase [Paucilactobacillus suebicus]|uniref:Acetyltransferase n=1 Tax=Paucilactobacillus suebicus DSM 5007 = KCTC 3549 TaxID=1423807 RepID=A0A0R1W0L5_9LACO|nr:sugar O-acetyltransferase [Paucilactobacillus suebicus]KRM11165.1 galactoside O-acetyltransferase [Paucilactobacillus suebicus DSM 5007 = KCTC 3549]
MSEINKMHDGELYLPDDPEIMQIQVKCQQQLYEFNQIAPINADQRSVMLKKMFAEYGDGSYIEPPLRANFGGHFVHFGKNVYANSNLTMVDDTHIYVGDNTMFGPNVTLATAGHPINPKIRVKGYQYNMPIHIGKNCWFGASVTVLPGITIGNNVVIGAGSIVTHNLPDNVVAVGDPCKVMREINEHDRNYYFKDRQIDPKIR